MKSSTDTIRDRARQLRRDQTAVESKLWFRLRARQLAGAKFRRQYPIGPFIADFCCMEHGLVVELDGSQHVEQEAADRRRSAFLTRQGYRVIRFWDNEVIEDIEAVLQRIMDELESPHPNPLPQGLSLPTSLPLTRGYDSLRAVEPKTTTLRRRGKKGG